MTARLLVVTPFGRRLGGSDNILLSVLRGVDRRRLEPTVAFLEPGPFQREVADLGVATHTLEGGRMRNPLHLASTIRSLRSLLRAERPDLILNWLSTAHIYGGPAAWLSGQRERCIWWQLDMHTDGPLGRGRLLDRLASATPARAIGACSEAAAASQAELWPHRPSFSVLPGIPPPRFPDEQGRMALSGQLGLPADELVVGTVGRLFAWKGHHRMLEAVELLRRQGVAAHALVVGGGGHRGDRRYESSLRALAQRPLLRGHVTLTGQVPDAATYMPLMDIFVNASSPEPFGLVLTEAMAAARPVVAVDAGGPREIVVAGETGLLARSGAPQDLAAALVTLAGDEELRRRFGDRGRRRYLAQFTEERMAAEMTERLLEMAA
jgi:glycosyltransferase involved in cell wall biosynthesis